MEKIIRYPKYNYTVNELGVYLALACNMNNDRFCYSTLKQLSKITDFTEKTISKILNKLEEDNLIIRGLDNNRSHIQLLEFKENYEISKKFILNDELNFKTKMFVILIKPYLKFNNYNNKLICTISRRKMCTICRISTLSLDKYLNELSDKGYYNSINNVSYFNYNKLFLDSIDIDNLDKHFKDFNLKLEDIIRFINDNINQNIKIDKELLIDIIVKLNILKDGTR